MKKYRLNNKARRDLKVIWEHILGMGLITFFVVSSTTGLAYIILPADNTTLLGSQLGLLSIIIYSVLGTYFTIKWVIANTEESKTTGGGNHL